MLRYRCHFCKANDHISFFCKKYASLEERFAHWKAACLCSLFTIHFHLHSCCSGMTYGLQYKCCQCSTKSHSNALCPVIKKVDVTSMCYQDKDQNQDFLLPIINIRLIKDGIKWHFNCLLDTGSQCSYLLSGLLDWIGFNEGLIASRTYDVHTFLGSWPFFKWVKVQHCSPDMPGRYQNALGPHWHTLKVINLASPRWVRSWSDGFLKLKEWSVQNYRVMLSTLDWQPQTNVQFWPNCQPKNGWSEKGEVWI